MRRTSTQAPVFPLDYDKNGNEDRESHRFTQNFNEWTDYIRASVDPNFRAGEILLAEAKGLLIKQEVK